MTFVRILLRSSAFSSVLGAAAILYFGNARLFALTIGDVIASQSSGPSAYSAFSRLASAGGTVSRKSAGFVRQAGAHFCRATAREHVRAVEHFKLVHGDPSPDPLKSVKMYGSMRRYADTRRGPQV
jgi:hypothetical protein